MTHTAARRPPAPEPRNCSPVTDRGLARISRSSLKRRRVPGVLKGTQGAETAPTASSSCRRAPESAVLLLGHELADEKVGPQQHLHDRAVAAGAKPAGLAFTELLLPVTLLEYAHMGLPGVAARLPMVER